jgi:hypothetical protein
LNFLLNSAHDTIQSLLFLQQFRIHANSPLNN